MGKKRRTKTPEDTILELREELAETQTLLKERDALILRLRRREGHLMRNLCHMADFCGGYWTKRGEHDKAEAARVLRGKITFSAFPYHPLTVFPGVEPGYDVKDIR